MNKRSVILVFSVACLSAVTANAAVPTKFDGVPFRLRSAAGATVKIAGIPIDDRSEELSRTFRKFAATPTSKFRREGCGARDTRASADPVLSRRDRRRRGLALCFGRGVADR
jgi:hypothetical protein